METCSKCPFALSLIVLLSRRNINEIPFLISTGAPYVEPSKGKKKSSKENKQETLAPSEQTSTMKRLFGFEKEDISSWHRLVCLLNRPTDPASLGIFRFLFGEYLHDIWNFTASIILNCVVLVLMCDVFSGMLMALDITQERGLSHLDYKYLDGAPVCRFPLFNFLKPLPMDWMFFVYFVMFLGEFLKKVSMKYNIDCHLFLNVFVSGSIFAHSCSPCSQYIGSWTILRVFLLLFCIYFCQLIFNCIYIKCLYFYIYITFFIIKHL